MSVAYDQAKLVKQRNEIARLTQRVGALTNDLVDIKADRDLCKDFVRMWVNQTELTGDSPPALLELGHRARSILYGVNSRAGK